MNKLVKDYRLPRIHAWLSLHTSGGKYSIRLTYDDKIQQPWTIAQNLTLQEANKKFPYYAIQLGDPK